MKPLLFDLETDGFLDVLTVIHCITAGYPDEAPFYYTDHPTVRTGETYAGTILEGLAVLAEAPLIVGHNIIKYDIPAILKLYPKWKPKGIVRDTLVMASVVWPSDHIKTKDMKLFAQGKIPGNLMGVFTLEAFGYRLGEYKGDYTGEWHTFTEEMLVYALQDVVVTGKLWTRLERAEWAEESYALEHDVCWIIARQERRGFTFNTARAAHLLSTLTARKGALEDALKVIFPPLEIRTPIIPKVNRPDLGYVKGVLTYKVAIQEFKPSSRPQIEARLRAKYGWEPTELTKGGRAKLDETTLSSFDWPEARLLSEYLMIDKVLGYLANGDNAWLQLLGADGAMHGRVKSNGAITGRMTHSSPNLANVPGIETDDAGAILKGSPGGWGFECRDLYEARLGYVLVGCDASALELRNLAHFMHLHDDGAYTNIVLNGKKSDGTEIHSVNAKVLGCKRSVAKTWFYAFIYGGGDEKLGHVLGVNGPKTINTRTGEPEDKLAKAAGKKSKKKFMVGLPALAQVIAKVKNAIANRGYLNGLDKRKLYCRSDHAALNTLLQSAGAVVMKKALVILDDDLQAAGLIPGADYEFVANVHDEWQIEVRPEHVALVMRLGPAAIRAAGAYYSFRCPLDGEAKQGKTWADTH